MVMPQLLLQKPSKQSKAKDHSIALKRRLATWSSGNIMELYKEGLTIQSRMSVSQGPKSSEALSRKFSALMKAGKVSAAVKLLTSEMSGGILPLSDETFQLLQTKHPESKPCHPDALIDTQAPEVHEVVFDTISEASIKSAAMNTKGGSGPSGLDADSWRNILASRRFGQCTEELRTELALATKQMCIEKVEIEHHEGESPTSSLEAFLACRLIPLDKNPGLRPIGVGEVLRRIIGKVVMQVLRKDVQEAAGSLQVCDGQSGGCEAAVHAMRNVFEDDDSDAVLLIDAANAFNSINRCTMLENISRLCPIAYVYAYNCYTLHARLFIVGGRELRSKEGTMQGDPVSMALYGLGLIPLLSKIKRDDLSKNIQHVAYADDLTGGGCIRALRKWFDNIVLYGPSFGYDAEPSKSWLVVKESDYDEAVEVFKDTDVNITKRGKKHLGAVVGQIEYRKEFLADLVEN